MVFLFWIPHVFTHICIGGFYAAIWLIQADLAWHPQWLGLPGHNANLPCCKCGLPKEEILQVHAIKPNLGTNREFLERLEQRQWKIVLWDLVPGAHVSPDIMHTTWLGTDTYFLGSVLGICLDYKFDGNLDDMTAALLKQLAQRKLILKCCQFAFDP